ncbi:crossover junction endodeoxyribonuclease RuvC [Planctomonas psychrotolerans]|uniref:crossover junction endodeoxyribonuclease RuvC n=1 Tax=Planctomonas psychrotolerans TaxID=2528712 RepID=UPI00123A8E9B|nr:crossover junction endodeoxyribonuclease RuvC [Planctomonas psychrotolerans]
MPFRVLGIDPGLTRCGIGVVDVRSNRSAVLVEVSVVRTTADMTLDARLLELGRSIEDVLDRHRPDVLAIERVFAQQNLKTVMGVAQISGVALHEAARRGIPVALHTPSEVKAAVTGYGSADKRQVGTMVARILGLTEAPKPADAADALAIAICAAWRQSSTPSVASPARRSRVPSARSAAVSTPAQAAWLAAERAARSRR